MKLRVGPHTKVHYNDAKGGPEALETPGVSGSGSNKCSGRESPGVVGL